MYYYRVYVIPPKISYFVSEVERNVLVIGSETIVWKRLSDV